MVEKLTFDSPATALVHIPAISIPIKTSDICGIVLCDKTAHFRVTFHCCLIRLLICHTCQVDRLSWQMRNAH